MIEATEIMVNGVIDLSSHLVEAAGVAAIKRGGRIITDYSELISIA